MTSTEAGLAVFFQWRPHLPGSVMSVVIALALGARFGLERVALRFVFE